MVASSKAIKVGPWGGTAGSPWDDGAHRGVRSIALTYGRFLESMRVEYDRNGHPVHGEKHGGGGDGRTSRTAEVRACVRAPVQVSSSTKKNVHLFESLPLSLIDAGEAGLPVRVPDRRRRPVRPGGARRIDGGSVADVPDEHGGGARAVRGRVGGRGAVRVPDGGRRGGRVQREERVVAPRRRRPARRGAAPGDALRRGPGARRHGVPVFRLRERRQQLGSASAAAEEEAVRVVLQISRQNDSFFCGINSD